MFNFKTASQRLGLLLCLGALLIGCQDATQGSGNTDRFVITRPNIPDVGEIVLDQSKNQVALAAVATLENPDFETLSNNVPTAWQESCNAPGTLQSSSTAISGVRAALISKNKSCIYQTAQVLPGQTLQLGCQARLQQNLGWSGLGFSFADAAFNKISEAPARQITSTTYSAYSTSATAPSNAAYVTVWAYTDGQVLLDACNLGVQSVPPINANNLLVNPGFESGLANWTGCSGTGVGLSNQSVAGANALSLGPNTCTYQGVNVTVGQEYALSCQARSSGYRWTTLTLAYLNTNYQTISSQAIQITSGTYQNHNLKLTAPAGTQIAAVVMYNESTNALFDECILNATTAAPPPPSGFNGGPQAASKGAFGPVQSWPTIAMNSSLMPNGKVVAWYSKDNVGDERDNVTANHDSTQVFVWDPTSNSFSRADNTTTDLFCAGMTTNANGQLIASGGNLGSPRGKTDVNLFDQNSNTWTRLGFMTQGRWYPTTTALANGEVLMIGGTDANSQNNTVPDVLQTNNTIRRLSSAVTINRPGGNFPHYYPWMHVAPNGQVFNAGPTVTMSYLNTAGNGSWGNAFDRGDGLQRTYGSSVMYAQGKLLVLGGLSSTARTIDINTANPQVLVTGSMAYTREHQNAVALPDGRVLVIGGNQNGVLFDDSQSVYESEIWSPSTGAFSRGALMQKPRNYHSSSLLLPDGRVLSAGGGGCGTASTCTANQFNAEIYYPPYLFKNDGSGNLAAQPSILSVPNNLFYNQGFSISSNEASTISGISLMRLGAATHAFDESQRRVPLGLGVVGTTINSVAPANANLAPPGYYMLFIINNQGVPSVSRIVKLQ